MGTLQEDEEIAAAQRRQVQRDEVVDEVEVQAEADRKLLAQKKKYDKEVTEETEKQRKALKSELKTLEGKRDRTDSEESRIKEISHQLATFPSEKSEK